ncbi:MAG: OmpA family protein [Cycloclasticus sp.]
MADTVGMKLINLILFTTIISGFAGVAQAQQYQASVTDSQWQFTGNRVVCRLSHTVPQFGKGVFEQKSGERVNFTLSAESYVPPIQTAMLATVPPVWMHDATPTKLASVKASAQQLVVNSDLSERMLQELSNGRFPQFSYQAKQGNMPVNVAISSVNFLAVLGQFESCRQSLLPFSRDDVHHQLSLFNNLSSEITHRNRRLLSKAITYVKEAGEEERIDLISGTDDFSVKDGRRMYDKRITKVREFLIENGMSEKQVVALADPEALDEREGSVRLKVAGAEPFRHIYFNSGSLSLNERDQAKLNYMLEYIRLQKPGAKLVLEGHSDSKGPRHANLLMSKKRVNVIKKFLLSKGIKADKIVSKAYGESKPATTNRYPGGRQLNRRVDISITG